MTGIRSRTGLVGGVGFAVDASLIAADANKGRSIPGSEWNKDIDPIQAGRAVEEYLATLDDAAYGAATDVLPGKAAVAADAFGLCP